MGCFLACFGSSKDQKRRKQRHQIQVQPREQRHASYLPVENSVLSKQENTELPNSVVPEIRDEIEEKLSLSSRKKVTFDTNVTTYEHVPVDASTDSLPETVTEKEESVSQSSSENRSSTSSTRSYPSGHRYQNCRESDDEEDECDLDDEYDGDDDMLDDYDEGQDSNDFFEEDEDLGYAKRRMKNSAACVSTEEVDGPLVTNARDRSKYVHPVLNPVENISQWKAVKKAKGTQPLKPEKENFDLDQESRVSFSLEPSFKGSMFGHYKKSNTEVAIDASLSNWLVTPETTPNSKAGRASVDAKTPQATVSKGSNSMASLEDRPILGALTVAEIKQMSASNSPRKSPSRSPDEMPIIGTVGTYWSHEKKVEDFAGSVSSFKGIPNTTSKYREDKTVNWHSTPFETRLERALIRGSPEA